MKTKTRKTKQREQRVQIDRPMPIQTYNITHGTRLRYTVTTAFNNAITWQNLLDTFLFASSSTVGIDAFTSVKIRAIEAWSLPALGSTSTVNITFFGTTAGLTADLRLHTDTSMGLEPAHVLAKPSRQSLASDYQVSSSNTAFYLTAPVGTVIDVALSFQQSFIDTVNAQNALVGASGGSWYIRGLDGKPVATSSFTSAVGYQI
jgi:hypothetical protein